MQDVDKLEKAIKGLKGVIKAGEKILADGKVDFSDSQYVPELYAAVKECVEAGKAYKEMGTEAKDIDGAEAVKLVTILFS